MVSRRFSSILISRSFDCSRFRIVCRSTMNFPFLVLSHVCVFAKKVERLGLALAAPFAVLGSIAAEFHQARLFGVQFKMEPLESLPEFLQDSLGVLAVLESGYREVIGKAHDDHFTASMPLPPLMDPFFEHVVQIRLAKGIHFPLEAFPSPPVFASHPHHTTFSHFLIVAAHAGLLSDCSTNCHQPFVVDGIEEPANVRVELDPVHQFLRMIPT